MLFLKIYEKIYKSAEAISCDPPPPPKKENFDYLLIEKSNILTYGKSKILIEGGGGIKVLYVIHKQIGFSRLGCITPITPLARIFLLLCSFLSKQMLAFKFCNTMHFII